MKKKNKNKNKNQRKNTKHKIKRNSKYKIKRNSKHKIKRKTKKKHIGGALETSVEVHSGCDGPEYNPVDCLEHRIFKGMRKIEDEDRITDNRDDMDRGYCMGNALGGRIFAEMIKDPKYETFFGEYGAERLSHYKCPILYTDLVELVIQQESVKSNHSNQLWTQKIGNCIEHDGKFYMFYCPYHLSLIMRGGKGKYDADLQIRDTFNSQIEKVEHCKDYDPIKHPDIASYIKDTVENCPPILPLHVSTERTTCVPRDSGCA